MAHNLDETLGSHAIAYIDATPWHSFGRNILKLLQDAPIGERLDLALTEGGLRYDVELQPIYDARGAVIAGHQVNMRYDAATGRFIPLGVVGETFRNAQNAEVAEIARPLIEDFGCVPACLGALGNGERAWMLLRMADATITPLPGDDSRGYFLLHWGHDGNVGINGQPTAIRVVCQNTLNMAVGRGGRSYISIRHTSSAGARIDQAAKLMATVMERLKATGETFATMAQTAMAPADIVRYIDRIIPNTDPAAKSVSPVIMARRETIARLVHAGRGAAMANQAVSTADGSASLWAVYNAVTEYVDHVRPAEAQSDAGRERANVSAIFGGNSEIKTAALVAARELVAA